MSLVYAWNRIYYVYLGGLNKKKNKEIKKN